jgi:hypothetical protein
VRKERRSEDPIFTAQEAVSEAEKEVWDVRPNNTLLRAMSIRIEETEYLQGVQLLCEVAIAKKFQVHFKTEEIKDFGVVTLVNTRPIIDLVKK